MPPKRKALPKSTHKSLISAANANSEFHHLISASSLEADRALVALIKAALAEAKLPVAEADGSNFVRSFCCVANNYAGNGKVVSGLADALAERKKKVLAMANARQNFLKRVGITKAWKKAAGGGFWDQMQTFTVKKLKTAYPCQGTWPAESQEILDLWKKHIQEGYKPDIRLKRHPLELVDDSRLKLTIPSHMSCAVVDEADPSDIVLIVLRDFCHSQSILDWLAGIIAEAVATRRSSRLDDPGSLMQISLSAGSRNRPAFDWVKNLRSKKHSSDAISEFDRKQCAALAFYWNLLKHRLPPVILQDFKDYLDNNILPPMSPLWQDATSRLGSYSVEVGKQVFEFRDVELSPPTAVMAKNYSHAMHYEHQPHKWAAAFTVARNASEADGGHFYVGSHGIKVMSSANTLVIWQPRGVHGTSLQNRNPEHEEPAFLQSGVAFVTSNRLLGVWKKYANTLKKGAVSPEIAADEARHELWFNASAEDEVFTE